VISDRDKNQSMKASKILVVDDEADLQLLIRQRFRKKIKAGEYEFVFALNGHEALDQVVAHPDLDLVLSDINMPGMDGLTLLGKLNEIVPLTKTVMVSAYGDMDNIRTAMNNGAFDFVVKPVNFEDLELTMEKTLRHVQQTKETLVAIKENNILKMYVDDNVLNFMTSREFEQALTANETIEATVMFIDICKFTAISEKESPDTVVKLLNQYFELMVEEICEHGGQVDKFLGDSVMAVFKGEGHLAKAIKAGLAVRKKISDFNATSASRSEVRDKSAKYKLDISIGINSGEMVSGNIGSASLKRLDYTVIGDVVNVAQRLEAAAAPNQLLITDAIAQRLNGTFNCQRLGEVELKNKELPVVLWELLD